MNWLAQILHWHRFNPWKVTGEVPIWKHCNYSRLVALAVRPTIESDYWVVRGKIMEQKRACRKCGFTEVEFKKLYLDERYHG